MTYSIVTTDPLVSPVFANDFADWARLDSDDPAISSCLTMATSLVISFLKLDLLTRTYTLKYKHWPTIGTNTFPSVARNNSYYKGLIDLPYANLVAVTSVKLGGVLSTDYIIVDGKPDKLEFDTVTTYDDDTVALEVIYTAGFGTVDDIPQPILDAIMVTASFIYSHRGGCNVGNAVHDSGAGMLLAPFAVMGGLVL
jgi:hypothetical protein